jgi:FKBP-type peptidyl-prolyl cis-trans isomerase (trigger factor)
MTSATHVKISRDESAWEVEISAELPPEAVAKYRANALKNIQRDAQLDGFRKGKAPEDAILRVYGETAIMRAAAEEAIQHELPELLAKQDFAIVDTPRVTTSEPVSGKPLSFTARAALAPEIDLADYKKIAEVHRAVTEDTDVTDKEHEDALTHLRRERHRIDKVEAGIEPQKAAEESRSADTKDLPELDDAFVQSLGYPDAKTFSVAVRTNLGKEKKMRAQEKKRTAILDELVEKSKIRYPKALLEYELADMEARMKDDLSRIGQTFESYLAQVKKTREEIRESWKEGADKRAKVRLILGKVAQLEKLEPDEKDVEHELIHAKEHYPQANPASLRAHIVHMMRNELVLRFLEGNPPAGGEPLSHGHAQH